MRAAPRPPAQLKQSDGDEERKGVYVSDEEEHELPGGSKARREGGPRSAWADAASLRCGPGGARGR